jgi:sterol desaturase/sphingolipid hydroxylase (fatty acid hydroxylase superfamily)
MNALLLLNEAVHASLQRGQQTVCLLAIFILLELLIPMQAVALGSRWRGLAFSTLGGLTAGVTFTLMQALWTSTGVRPFITLHFNEAFGWTGPLALVIGPLLVLMLTDFLGYWMHRLQHGPLWRFHALHHSVRDLHASSAYVHVADEFFRIVLIAIPMSLAPIDGVVTPFVFTAIAVLYEPYIHSPIRLHLGPLRRVFTDNRFHRIHHSRTPAHFDKNFGVYFTLWDQLFGTAYFPKPGEWPETGLAEIDEPKSVREWLDFPLRYRPMRAVNVAARTPTHGTAPADIA